MEKSIIFLLKANAFQMRTLEIDNLEYSGETFHFGNFNTGIIYTQTETTF